MPGGFLGIDPTVSTSEAKGRWGVDDVYEYRLENIWPRIFNIEYLVVAGGGGAWASSTQGGGGGAGAGGYRSSISGESSGGGTSAENAKSIYLENSFTVTVGAGGYGGIRAVDQGTGGSNGGPGSSSSFSDIASVGGGYSQNYDGIDGGSGAGATFSGTLGGTPGSGTSGQGFAGGSPGDTDPPRLGGGGGGASEVGEDAIDAGGSLRGGNGGDGVASLVTGVSTYFAGGGGGGYGAESGTPGTGGLGGGGNGSNGSDGEDADANTGGGGGGAGGNGSDQNGGAGGSGIVILKYPQLLSIDAGPGLTYFTNIVGDNKISQFVGGTDDISFTTTPLDKSIVYTDRYVEESPGTTTTYSGLSFGTATNRNVVAVFIGGRNDAAISSVTIGGQPASLAYGQGTGGFSYIYYATGVAGTSGDVVVDWSTLPNVAGVGVYSLYNLDSVDPVDGGVIYTAGASSLTVSGIAGGAGGVGLAGTGVNDSNLGSQTFSATDSQSITEIWDEATAGSNSWAGAALYDVTSDNFDVTVTYSEDRNNPSLAVAVWK